MSLDERCGRRAAAGEAGAAKRGTPDARAQPILRRLHACRLSDRLALRNVCRAGFAGRGTASARSTERHRFASAFDPRRSLGSRS